ANQRDLIVRHQYGDREGTADHIRSAPEGITPQVLGGNPAQPVLRQDGREKVEIFRIDPIEAQREPLRVVDVDPRDRPVAVGGENALDLRVDDQPPGEGYVV